MMKNEQQSLMIVRLMSVAFFLAFTVTALMWFIISTTRLISQFTLNAAVVEFDMGSMYMLGGGLCCLLITVGGIMQGLFGKKLTHRMERLFARGMIGGLILMFGLPYLAHYAIAGYLQQKQYRVCSDITYRWLLYRKYYYTQSDIDCTELARKKKK